jgi:RNA polymerase sigma-70 factor (ECF subfamily)
LARSNEQQTALADSPADTPLVVGDRAASTPAAADPERLPPRVPDDTLLWRYVADGDQAAFRTLVRRHERVVLATCQRVLGDPHMAQEALQATFMVLARKARVLDARRPLTAWLCKVAFRAALRLRAAVAKRRRHEREAARPSAVLAPLSADLERKEIFQALAEELQHLPEKYRAPLILCYLDGRTHTEAAQVIGLPRGSMAKRIREGLLRLRERLATRGFVA